MSPASFRQIGRGSKGSNVMNVKDEDVVEHMFLATTHSYLMIFTSIGKVHWIKGYQIPEGGKQATGRAIVNLLQFQEGERLTAVLPINKFDDQRRLFMVTKYGVSKMVKLSDFSKPKAKGIIALKLDENDELISVKPIVGGEQVVIATRNGYAIRFPESEVRVMGRAARGVKAIAFREQTDYVVGMEVFSKAKEEAQQGELGLDTATENQTGDQPKPEVLPETVADEPLTGEEAAEGEELPQDDNVKYAGTLLTVSELGFSKQLRFLLDRLCAQSLRRGHRCILAILQDPRTDPARRHRLLRRGLYAEWPADADDPRDGLQCGALALACLPRPRLGDEFRRPPLPRALLQCLPRH